MKQHLIGLVWDCLWRYIQTGPDLPKPFDCSSRDLKKLLPSVVPDFECVASVTIQAGLKNSIERKRCH